MFRTQQDQEAFVQELQQAPDATKNAIAQEAWQAIQNPRQRTQSVAEAVRQLPAQEQADVLVSAGLGPADGQTTNLLWVGIVFSLIVLIFFLLIALIFKSPPLDTTTSDYIKTIISLCVGAIIGLVSPTALKSAGQAKTTSGAALPASQS